MCLVKITKFPKKAESDIEVYKIIEPGKDQWVTPYRKEPVHFGKPLKSKWHPFWGILKEYINGEGVHAFLGTRNFYNSKINYVKAIIPKGTWYWLGINNEIASEKLIITNEYHLSYSLSFYLNYSKTKSLLNLGLDPRGACEYQNKHGIRYKTYKKHSIPMLTLEQILNRICKEYKFYLSEEDTKLIELKITLQSGIIHTEKSRSGLFELVYKTAKWFLENENKTNR